jgi:hypothetical protein
MGVSQVPGSSQYLFCHKLLFIRKTLLLPEVLLSALTPILMAPQSFALLIPACVRGWAEHPVCVPTELAIYLPF